MPDTSFIGRLQDVVGAKGLLLDSVDTEPFLQDWRGLFRGEAVAVVRPACAREVADVVGLCARFGVRVVPQGGNTGLAGGAVPLAGGGPQVLLSLSRMNAVRRIDRVGMTMEVEAGCILQTAQEAARSQGRMLPISLASEGSAQIGGVIASNAGGVHVVRHGMTRQSVLGLEVVLADGTLLDGLRHLRKDNAGYDWKQLFIGSEGTLGIVTGAVLKLFAKPASDAVAMVGLDDIDAALRLLHHVQARAGSRLTNFEVICAGEYDLVMALPKRLHDPLAARHPWVAIVELTDADPQAPLEDALATIVHDAMERGIVREAVLAASKAQAELIWEIRHSVTEANVNAGLTFSHDTSVPVSRVPDFVRGVERLVAERFPAAKPVFVGHVGDGNIHAVVVLPREAASATADVDALAAAVNATIDEVALSLDGSISAEHGIGRSNRARLRAYLDPADFALMQGIKSLFDPRGLMNPGVLP